MKLLLTRLLICALLAATAAAAPSPAPAQDSLRIAAVVNDGIISAYDLAMRMRMVMITSNLPNTPQVRGRLGPEVLRNLIDEQIMLQEAKQLEIKVSDAEMAKAMAQIESRNGMAPGGLATFLQQAGIDKDTMDSQVRASIAWSKVVQRKFRPRIKVGEDEVEETIARMEANKGKPEFQVSEIFLPLESPELEGEVRTLAERLLGEIHNGGNFGALAQSFSKNAAADAGGDLGWIRKGDLGPEVESVLERMQVGQVAGPVRSQAGFHLIHLADKRIDPGLGGDEESVALRQLYIPLRPQAAADEVAKATAKADGLAAQAADCAQMDKLAPATGSDLSGNMGTVKLSGLPAPIRDVLQNLPVGQASRPLRSGDGVLVLMVCDRTGRPDREQIKQRVVSMLMDQRLSTAARHYLRDLRRAAFVDVRI
ncbi:MAG: peptidylprolyl isomerase [Hyphomicrobiales bacterium]|nr:peptidylprolyl isomerase [Hyphomicrobiales bacterium]MCP5373861.1 peptidylprolyl isomerase [Hyphomicrobiales bacterium]